MTRHRKGDIDGDDEDVPPWRAKDYENAPRRSGAAPDRFQAPYGDPARGSRRPARGALGTSSSRDLGPGEATGPPWESPGWDDSQPGRRAPRPGGLTGGHPSGPLPRVSSSGPLPRVPDSWPGATSGPMPSVPDRAGPGSRTSSGPLPAVPGDPRAPRPPDGRGRQEPAGRYPAGDARGGRSRDGYPAEPYPAEPYQDRADPGYQGGGRAYPGRDDAPYLRTGVPDTGYGRGPEPGYPERDPGYGGDYGDPSRGPGGYEREDYPGDRDYRDGDYAAGDYGHERDYPGEQGYQPGAGYPSGDGYAPDETYLPEEGYPGDGYARDGGYPGHASYSSGQNGGYPDDRDAGYPGGRDAGYPGGQDAGYPGGPEQGYPAGDDYAPGRGQQPPRDAGSPRDPHDDHGYGDEGDWYGDVEDDQPWAEDGYTSGILPGLGSGTDSRRASAGAPGRERAQRAAGAGASRPRGGGGGGKARGRKSTMRRLAPWIALSVVVVVLTAVGGVGYYFYRNYLHPPDYSGPGTGSVTVHIQSGESATQVGQQLLQLGVVASVRAFSNAAKNSGKGSSLEVGYYRLHKHMAAALAFALLLKPSSRVQLNVIIPPGLRLYEIINLLGKDTGNLKGYEQAIKDTKALGLPSYAKGNPEGYLFPDTYTVQPSTSPTTVLQMMSQRFGKEASSVQLSKWARKDQISEGDIITVASICQAEGRGNDMPMIARVIYNRLNLHMRLQLDSTVLYALHSRASDVTLAQTHTKSPYNTYLHFGLPPGPIDTPSDAAIKAAEHPAKGNWTYFLTVNPGTGLTKFTNSYATFLIYVNELNAYLAKHH